MIWDIPVILAVLIVNYRLMVATNSETNLRNTYLCDESNGQIGGTTMESVQSSCVLDESKYMATNPNDTFG